MNEHLLRSPHDQGPEQWWCETPRGIVVVVFRVRGTVATKPITWRSLRKALARKDRR